MARISKAAKLAEIHETALRQFDTAYNATREDREASLAARRFVDIRGAQWDWDTAGDFAVRMKLEVNKVALACTRINNEYRANEIQAQFIPKDGSAADPLADLCASRYRADFQDSNGKEARDNAFDEGIKGGMGAVRLRTEYEDEDKGTQRIAVEPIHDAATSVYFDANSKRKDKSDAGHCFLIRPYTRAAYEDLFGDDASSFPANMMGQLKFGWFGLDLVYVAEYFLKVKVDETHRVFTGLNGVAEQFSEDDLDEGDVETMLAQGYIEGEPVKIKETQIRKYTLSGSKVLSDDGVIAGDRIPVAPFYAYRSIINGVERFRGHVAMAMDPQIISNIQFSKVAEIAASSAVEKPIFTPEQIAGHETRWNDDHLLNSAYMLVNPIIGVDGNPMPMAQVGFTKAPAIPDAIAALMQIADQNLLDILGNPQAGEVIQPNTSGLAMGLTQDRIDMQTSGYVENLGDMERLVGEIWLGMAKDIYTESGRKLKTMSDAGKRGSVELGLKKLNPETGETAAELDFRRAAFDVVAEVGPSSKSKRDAIVRSVTALMGVTTDPETMTVLTHVAINNMEGQGLDDMRDWSRKKLLGMGVIKPTKEEEAEMAAQAENTPPDPQAGLADALSRKAVADADLATAKVGEALSKGELVQAQTVKILSEIPLAQRESEFRMKPKPQEGVDNA